MIGMPIVPHDNLMLDDIYDTDQEFLTDFKASAVYGKLGFSMTDDALLLTFTLVYAKFANTPIANASADLFKLQFYSMIWKYGPTWQKDVDIQVKLRGLSLDSTSDIYKGSKAIYNHAVHPQTTPSTTTLDELTYIDDQNVTNYKKSTLEGLASLYELLKTDVTDAYINRFGKLFSKFVSPEYNAPLFYEEDN